MATSNKKLIPVAMLAHNEEQVIKRSLDSILGQQLPDNFALKVFVFANGCTDRTEEIVSNYSKHDVDKVELVSLSTKGKVAALKKSIVFFKQLRLDCPSLDRVIYVDADIELTNGETLSRLSHKLDTDSGLYLVAAFPAVDLSQETGWLIRNIFKAREFLQLQFKNNVVRGACYIIDFDVLQRVNYPAVIASDDMFLEVRLNGHTLMDYDQKILVQPKNTLKGEVERDLFTLLARNQIYAMKRKGLITSLDTETAVPELALTWFSHVDCVGRLIRHYKFQSLFFVCIWNLIHRRNQRRANKIMENTNLSDTELLGFWSTER